MAGAAASVPSPLVGEVSGRGVAASGLPVWTLAASGPPVWTPLPNPLPQGERELTAVAGTSMLHFRWIALEPVIGLAEGETHGGYEGDFEFKNSKRPKIIAFPVFSNYGAVSFCSRRLGQT